MLVSKLGFRDRKQLKINFARKAAFETILSICAEKLNLLL